MTSQMTQVKWKGSWRDDGQDEGDGDEFVHDFAFGQDDRKDRTEMKEVLFYKST